MSAAREEAQMQAVIATEEQREAWSAYIARNDFAIAWQVMEWHDLVRRHYPVEFFPLVVQREGQIGGILPLYRVRTGRKGDRLMSVPYAVAGGIVADGPGEERALLAKAVELHESLGTSGITLKQYKHQVQGELRTDDSYYNSELDISGGEKAVWGRISAGNREQIERTAGAKLRVESGLGVVDEFYELLLDHHHRRGIPCVSKGWVRDLAETGMYDAALIRDGERCLAGTMMKSFKKTVSFPFTCTRGVSEEDIRTVYRLYWTLIARYSAEGYEIFHSGRIPKNGQTDGYRLGWGGAPYGYFYQYYPAGATGPMEFASRRNRKRKVFEAAWRIAPRALTRALGPYFVRQFP